MKFGEKLRALRVHNGLTLKKLASDLGFNAHGYLSELECGKKKPTVDFTIKVADYFGISIDELLRDEIEIKKDSDQ